MMVSRPGCLRTLVLSFLAFGVGTLHAQQAPPAPPPPAQQNPPNPFQNVPQAPEAPKPEAPKPEAQPPAQTPGQPQPGQAQPNAPVPGAPQLPGAPSAANAAAPPTDTIEAVTFTNVRRVPQDSLRSLILSKAGDKYDKDALDRDM